MTNTSKLDKELIMDTTLDDLAKNHKVKLSIPLLATYLKRGVRQGDIAKICNVSHQAVSDYIKRHYDKLAPLTDSTGAYQAAKAQHIADFAQDRLLKHLPETEKKDLFALNAISGTHIDKYRLLSDKSTQNVSMDVNNASMNDTLRAIKDAESRIKKLTGEVIDV